MAKTSSMFECTACGTRYPKPMGKCGTCGAFGTIEEVRDRDLKRTGSAYALSQYQEPVPLDDVEVRDTERTATGLVELDRVLGGGVDVGGRSVDDDDAAGGGRGHVDIVETDTGAGDDLQLRHRLRRQPLPD